MTLDNELPISARPAAEVVPAVEPNVNAVDTTGAGDAYSAILCIGYLKGWNIADINETASAFASEIIKIKGAIPDNDSIYEKFAEEIK